MKYTNTLKRYLMDTYNYNNYCKGNYIFVVYDKHSDTYKAIFLKGENIAPIVELSQASRGKGARHSRRSGGKGKGDVCGAGSGCRARKS